jgi:hypothetical protein
MKNTGVFDNYYTLFENKNVIGFRTFGHTKLEADDLLSGAICSENVGFYENLIVTNTDQKVTKEFMREKLIHQLEEIREYVVGSPIGQPKRKVTSIYDAADKRIAGNKDDIHRALAMGVLVANWFYSQKLPVDYDYISNLRRKRREYNKDYKYISAKFADDKKIRPSLIQKIGVFTFG